MQNTPVIIPVASGKGGVGKTFLCANLAMALAGLGHKTIAVDLDLGGSNLNTFMGMKNQYAGIGDFLQAKSANLNELAIATNISNLKLIPGDGKTPFMANINFGQKGKLLRHIKKLDAEYVLLDLSAGSSFNTLDFFGLAHQGLLITTPEHHTIMNMLVFLKNFLFRIIGSELSKNHAVKQQIKKLLKQPIENQIRSVDALIKEVATLNPTMAKNIEKICQSFRPRVIFNEAIHLDDLKNAHLIDQSARSILSLELDYFGMIFYDEQVRKAIRQKQSFLQAYPETKTTKDINKIAERITKYWHRPIKNSAALLFEHLKTEKNNSAAAGSE